nr:glycosyltransferase family 1 protein [Lachnospiraceae bacterium]
MDFITQFENTLEHTISLKRLSEAKQLLAAYPSTGQPYSVRLFSMINDLRRIEYPFVFPLQKHAYRLVLFRTGNFILDYILEQFSAFFEYIGCELLLFDPTDYSASSKALFSFAQGGIDAAFFFNNVGLLQTFSDGSNLWETLHIPCYDFLVDHPMYYADSLDNAPADTTLLCADKTHTNYALRFYPRLKHAIFMPTGGCNPLANANSGTSRNAENPKIPWQERPMDVLFIGSFKYHPHYEKYPLEKHITKHLQIHTQHTFEQAVELYATEPSSNDHISDSELKLIIEQHRFLETNVTALYRKAIIKDILDAGITIHVYGEGWTQTGLTDYENFILHAPVSFEEGIKLMSQAKILLNHMAWFKHGSSERIFNAMAQGAVCVTDSSKYLDTILKHQENCCIYSLNNLETNPVSQKIISLLSDPETAAKIAEKGKKTASQHTWQNHLHFVTKQMPI